MTRKLLASLGVVLLAFTLWGCGSNGGSGGGGDSDSDKRSTTIVGTASCVVCHTTIVGLGWTGSSHDTAAVGCERCHGGGSAHRGVGPIPYPSPTLAAQCSVCHTDAGMRARHAGDDPATSYQTTPDTPTVEGYVLAADEPEGCKDCHGNIHDPVAIEYNEAWANSAHAGRIASANPDTEAVWGHYDWDGGSRSSCQRCHTATGIKNFLTSPATYSSAANDFSHLEGWTATTSSQQNELLYCWGCHSDVATGALRNPGAISEEYNADDPATPANEQVLVNYPNIGQSNVCMGCHLGREIGEVIKVDATADGIRSFINSHYLTAGSTIFNESGYEYAGQVYNGFGFHKNVGAAGDGPCVTCHMSSAETHAFEVVEKNAAGTITAVASTQCATCHGPLMPTAATLEASKAELNSALEELNLALQARGMFFFNAHPYFYTAPNGGGSSFTDWQSVATAIDAENPAAAPVNWRDVMGAAFNYNLLEHDPGAYAHNHDYALKLIADSIDFLSNGLVDGDASLAADLLARGINVGSKPGYAPIHDGIVASEAECSICHSGAPHYAPVGKAQFVAEEITCVDCHAGGSIAAKPVILAAYAESGHADVAGTWSHEEAGGCSRCHTTSGFKADLAEPGAEYEYPNAEGSNRLQVLACAGCHSNLSTGARRLAPAFVATWDRNDVVATVNYPDVGDSNLCVRCHSARRAGPNITDTATTTAHYLPVAASVFGGNELMVSIDGVPTFTGVGYEFAGQSYLGLNTHGFVGSDDGTGPCVKCHMSGAAGHTWKPVTKDATGNYVSVLSTACVLCHSGMDAAHLNASKAAFTVKLNALEGALQAKGFYFNRDDGRFYQDAAFTTGVDADYYIAQAGTWDVSDLAGAVFNFWLFAYEGGDPCGFIHNLPYAEKLIADSIDFMNDGAVNGN